MNLKTTVVLLSLSLSALATAVAADVPEYGRGYDVYTTSSSAVLRGKTVFLTWPAGANRPERYLVAVDVADAATPKLLDKLALDGTTVYLIDQSFGLRLVDISRPERPVQIGNGLEL